MASSSACIIVAPAMLRIGSDTSTPTATATVLIFQRKVSTIGPVQGNFGSRELSNRPQ
jgi:hypothetical protein